MTWRFRGLGLTLIAGMTLTLALASPAIAASCQDVDVPDTSTVGGTPLVLNGLGLRKATLLKVKVYVAGLYLPAKSADGEQILGAKQAWQLVLHFVRDVDGSDLHDAFKEGFEKSGADLTPLQDRIDALNGLMIDFKEGQTLTFGSDPATGIAVAVDGTVNGTIEGEDFAATLLAIWLGPEPPNEELKTGLLGGACE